LDLYSVLPWWKAGKGGGQYLFKLALDLGHEYRALQQQLAGGLLPQKFLAEQHVLLTRAVLPGPNLSQPQPLYIVRLV